MPKIFLMKFQFLMFKVNLKHCRCLIREFFINISSNIYLIQNKTYFSNVFQLFFNAWTRKIIHFTFCSRTNILKVWLFHSDASQRLCYIGSFRNLLHCSGGFDERNESMTSWKTIQVSFRGLHWSFCRVSKFFQRNSVTDANVKAKLVNFLWRIKYEQLGKRVWTSIDRLNKRCKNVLWIPSIQCCRPLQILWCDRTSKQQGSLNFGNLTSLFHRCFCWKHMRFVLVSLTTVSIFK